MIYVTVKENSLLIEGHAGRGARGTSVPCAAVSAITLTLIRGLSEVAENDIQCQTESGRVRIEWEYLNEVGKKLVDTWYLGICAIQEMYQCIHFISYCKL